MDVLRATDAAMRGQRKGQTVGRQVAGIEEPLRPGEVGVAHSTDFDLVAGRIFCPRSIVRMAFL